jgi:fructoselysine-6-P-deglycase FrlB-like protein
VTDPTAADLAAPVDTAWESELLTSPRLERQRLDIVALVGTDASRDVTLRSIRVAAENGVCVPVLDAADYPALHALLAPFVLLVPLRWFTVWSALMRGITDLDERVFMGRRVLATGPDATWP